MKRFLKTLTLLVVSLFLLVSGVNATLDRLTQSTEQTSFTFYNAKGNEVVAYNGKVGLYKVYAKPEVVTPFYVLHRT